MKGRIVGLAMFLVAASTVWASPIGVYFDDDFNGTTLDGNEWTSNNNVWVSDSKVYVAASGGQSLLTSKDTVSPDAGQTVILTAIGVSINDSWPQDMSFGIDGVSVRITRYLSEGWGGHIVIGGQTKKLWDYGSPTYWDSVVITWAQDQVTLSANGSLVFDSTATGPYGGGSWTIPTTVGAVFAETYINAETISADRLKLEVVPEPATMGLLIAGGLGMLLRRKR